MRPMMDHEVRGALGRSRAEVAKAAKVDREHVRQYEKALEDFRTRPELLAAALTLIPDITLAKMRAAYRALHAEYEGRPELAKTG